ncbi:MAG: CPBP family intramembrane metalloprotease [Clostridia bacterium]|nr:CPBP family intramembrane metalloprotease [Clostridia bacterium]
MENNYYNTAYGSYDPSAAFWLRKNYEKKELGMLGKCTGMAVCIYILLSEVFVFVPYVFNFEKEYYDRGVLFYSLTMLSSVLCLLLPFVLMSRYEQKKLPVRVDFIPAENPGKLSTLLLCIPVGFGGCLLSNFISSYIDIFIQATGVELSSPEIDPGASEPLYLLMYFLCVAVCAPVCEETAMRGVVLQPLKKYGGAFAVGASATVFGLLHCNLIQTPCAIMAGIALGYIALVTGSIWAPVVVHFLNNFYSLFIGEMQNRTAEKNVVIFHYAVTVAGIFIGAVCLAVLVIKRRGVGVPGRDTVLTTGEKIKAYFFNVPMLVAFIFILIITKTYVSL